ncbi:MAG: trypsin-like peptidase domain-containing protein [Candidatus Doudnabacteria bacterium]|nr:trypsin-like peptidase domain-containing protein [Candidatus Doudnabacteria bacterium]
MIEQSQTKKEESLTQDLYDHSKTAGNKSVALLIILALVFGSLGGIVGAFYSLKNPKLQKYLGLEPFKLAEVNQTVVLSEESAVIDVVKKASPAVVSIVVTKDLSKLPSYNPFFPFFESPNQNRNEPNLQKVGAGSGFFVSKDGLILTNKHVVADKQAGYTVITSDNGEYEAEVVAIDLRNDLAILKVEIKDAPFLQLDNSGQIMIGQRVVAIGNSLGQYQNTVTTGVVSGIGRSITAGGNQGYEQLEGVIQTDAAINPGNSGGPLLNTAGQVIGINTAIDQEGQAVGFAIPSNDVKKALESYLKTGSIKRPFIGVRYIMITKTLAEKEKLPKDYGALILRGENTTDFAVVPGSPADKAGLSENDIILEVNGKELKGNTSLGAVLREADVGETVTLKVYSKGEEKAVRVTLSEAK